jgi:peroxiredoxin
VELRKAVEALPELRVVWVMAENQINARTLRFFDENGLRDRVDFLGDPGSAAIDTLGIRKANPEPMEEGVPHPTTYLLDENGIVQFVDVREDFHIWLDPEVLVEKVGQG